MSFTRTVKEEITRKEFPSACCKIACLSAFLRTAGSIVSKGSNVGFSFFTENAATAAYFCDIVSKAFAIEGNVKSKSSGEKENYSAEFLSDATLGALIELGILSVSADGVKVVFGIDKYITESECCKRAYIAGAFLGGGSCTVPSASGGSTGYHLEFVFSFYETAHDFAELLAEFDIAAKLIERKNTFVVYVKSNEEIQEILTIIGAEESVSVLAETVVVKDINNRANRKLNCDLSNISKQVAAAERQVEAIETISQTVGLSALTPELRAVAELRAADKVLTLEEMANELNVTKSCVNHRMRKIMQIANDLKN